MCDVILDDEPDDVYDIPNCASCGLPITARVDEYDDGEQKWHKECAINERELLE